MNKVRRWTAIVIAACGVFFNLPALVLGFSFLWNWVWVHTSDGPYFRWSYPAMRLHFVLETASADRPGEW
jgi:hypothetical protein